jgi:hypothetical protein
MTWARLDDGFPEHPKVIGLSDRAIRLWLTALCYCARNLTDGLVTEIALKNVARSSNLSRPNSVATALVDAGLWERTDDENGGYLIHDYLKYNPSKVDVERERAAARDRMQRHRSKEVRANVPANVTGERSPSPSPTTTTRSGVVGDLDRTSDAPPPTPPQAPSPATPRAPAPDAWFEDEPHPNGKTSKTKTAAPSRPALDIAHDRLHNIGAQIPPEHLQADLHDALGDRFDELTPDDLIELADQHADLLRDVSGL